jgi:DNA-binding LacI/PurR family transcriptional regulator
MLNWQRPSAVLQLAAYLRGELAQGRWAGRMPGVIRLAKELGTSRNTVEGALKKLEQDGYLLPQGHGKGRMIREDTVYSGKRMRVAILRHEKMAAIDGHIMELQHQLLEAGYSAVLAEKSLTDIDGDLGRLENLVQRTNAAAWVVVVGTREILQWFSSRDIPVYALFGRRRDLAIAGGGPDKSEAYRAVVRKLVELGHRRIVLLALTSRRLPSPGLPERAFLEELQAHGITTGRFNLPDWEETPEDLQHLLDACFRITPPTAFLVDEAYLFHATKHHLAAQGIRIPKDVSLVCTDPDRTFSWCLPSIAHIRWDNRPLLRHVLRWADLVKQRKEERKQINIPAEFVMGGTVAKSGA